MFELKHTPFHERTSKLSVPQNWRRWAGHIVLGSYDLHLDREYWAIRDGVAMIDVSPLMKYMIEGPDAARLLHKLTPRDVHKMAVGQVGYTGWCDDEGKLVDDGTVSRLDDQRFRMTSAEPSLRWLAMNAVGMDVKISEVTDQMAALSLQGPKSRAILNRCCAGPVDKLKYFRLTQSSIGNVPVTVSRTGYTGDLGYEIWMKPEYQRYLFELLMEKGASSGIRLFGLRALNALRVEKSFGSWAREYRPLYGPVEAGLGRFVATGKEADFIGKAAAVASMLHH